jgi:hypothetical protein
LTLIPAACSVGRGGSHRGRNGCWNPGLALKPAPPTSSAAPYVPTSDKRLEAFRLKLLANVRDAPDGQKHERLRDNAKTLGGIAARAGFSDEEAVRWLMDALAGKDVADWRLAERTALWGLAAGTPIPVQPMGSTSVPPRRPGRITSVDTSV